jgi:hypothetical protein
VQQEIRFCKGAAGVNLGYAISGSGAPLFKVANFLTHLEYDWRSPVVRPFPYGSSGAVLVAAHAKRSSAVVLAAPTE